MAVISIVRHAINRMLIWKIITVKMPAKFVNVIDARLVKIRDVVIVSDCVVRMTALQPIKLLVEIYSYPYVTE